jgi:hypothetical protein
MKKYISYIGLLIFSSILFSCNKDNFDYPDGYVGISKITTYPTITVKGAAYIVIPKGGTFTDPGVTAVAGTATVPVVATGLPNTNTVGVYLVTYTATNTDGFSATASRTVVVYSTDATAVNNDFSGNYARSTNGSLAVWTKLAPGVYSVFNPGGAPGTNLTVIAFNQTGYNVFIPSQIAGGNPTSSASETSTPGTVAGTLKSYAMQIVNPTYGPAVRTFVKQ